MIQEYDNDTRPRMPLARVTATLPRTLVEAADRLARQLGVSRSAFLSQALRAFVGRTAAPPAGRARIGEEVAAPYDSETAASVTEAGDGALLAELARRLAAQAGAASPPSAVSPGQPRMRVDRAQLAELCRRHHIRRLSLFGSVLRDDFGPTSDVDVLVEFEPGQTIGFEIVTIEDELSALFGGRRVDLVTARALHPLVRDRVLATAVAQYAA